jgi:hypothetical protein
MAVCPVSHWTVARRPGSCARTSPVAAYPRVVGADILVGEAEALQRPGPEILDDDIGLFAKRLGDLARLGPFEIEAEASFASILLHEV